MECRGPDGSRRRDGSVGVVSRLRELVKGLRTLAALPFLWIGVKLLPRDTQVVNMALDELGLDLVPRQAPVQRFTTTEGSVFGQT